MEDTLSYHKELIGKGWLMFKPKSSVGGPRALLYRRFTSLEQSQTLQNVYKTSDNKFWTFDADMLEFVPVGIDIVGSTIISIETNATLLAYQGKYFKYDGSNWVSTTDVGELGTTLLSASFNNIGKYQTNKYYYVGSFDFMIRGLIDGTTTQYVKGQIVPLNTMNIRTFNDDVRISEGDLCVVDKRLYSVENPETTQKRMPKAFNIHFATLNSIL